MNNNVIADVINGRSESHGPFAVWIHKGELIIKEVHNFT
jgi:hypothetical protein